MYSAELMEREKCTAPSFCAGEMQIMTDEVITVDRVLMTPKTQ